MKLYNKFILRFTIGCLGLLAFANSSSFGQQKRRLRIGDSAPALVYSSWIKGEPTSLSGNKIYILEFWATWCGPCIASMPHLSELAEKYNQHVEVIAVDASERTGSQPYSSCIPMVKTFVEKNTAKMKFNVIIDDDARGMNENWLEAAHVMGIPATIIVKSNIVQWIGHPQQLEPVLSELVEGTFDLAKRKSDYEAAEAVASASSVVFKKNMAEIDSLVAGKQYEAAKVMSQKFAVTDVEHAASYGLKRLQLMIAYFPEKDLLQYLKSVDKGWATSFAMYLSGQNGLPKSYYQAAADIMAPEKDSNVFYSEIFAELQARLGNYKAAVLAQQKALDLIRAYQAEEPNEQSEEAMKAIEQKLADYKLLSTKK